MKTVSGMTWLAVVCVTLQVARGAESPLEPRAPGSSPDATGMSTEFDANYGFAAGSKAHTGGHDLGYVSEQNSGMKGVVSPELSKDLLLRAGFEWERLSFGLPGAAPLPNTLQQLSAIIGFDYQIDEHWLMRMELAPGLYSDFEDLSWCDVDAPLILGGSYLVDADLQWFLGLRVDVRSRYWLVPAAGVRWKFGDAWTLNLLFPNPRVEYELNKRVTFYLGGRVLAGTYRLADNFATSHGMDPRANQAMVDFMELRAGPGVSWKALPNLTVEAEVGCMLYREFEFSDPHMYIRSNNPAPYAQISCHVSF